MSETTTASEASARVRRKDGDHILTGKGRYLDDIELPGTLHAAILRSPHAHARIVSIDTSGALEQPGARLAMTGAEALALVGPIPHFFDPAVVDGHTTEFRCLAVDKVVYAGEPVAAVVADSINDAEAALDAIAVEYELLPTVLNVDEATQDGAPLLYEEWEENVVTRLPFAEGDATSVLRDAKHVLEDEIRIQRYQTAPMETRGYIASWEDDGRLTFYGSNQNPHPLRTHLARMLDVPENGIHIVATRLGGAFGHKFHGYPEEPLVCVLSRAVGAPVQWTESRSEAFLVGGREYTHRFAVAYDDEGQILAIRNRILADVGALGAIGGWGMSFVAGMAFPGPYKVEHYDVESIPIVTNKPPWNGARSYGKESATLAIERMIDLISQSLDLDPATVRYRNFIPADQFPYKTAAKRLDSGNYAGALEQALDLIKYEDCRRDQEHARDQDRLLGIGVGFELTPEGGDFPGSLSRGFDTSTVRIDPSGKVTVLTGVTDPGTGNETTIAQLVAAEFGIAINDVTVRQGDTDLCPYGFGNFSSRSLSVGGGSALLAAREVRGRLADAASVLLEAESDELVFAGGEVQVRNNSERSMQLSELANSIFNQAIAIPGIDEPQLEATKTYGPTKNLTHVPDEDGKVSPYPTFPYSAHVSVVDVDRETGMVEILAYAAVDDCGVVINPMFVEGQFLGAIVMGIGGALWEELPYGSDGQLLATTFKHYLLPRAPDLPHIETGSQVTPSPYTLLGTKGAGEGGVAGAVASIANAVNDALHPLGVSVNDMPLSAPKLLRAIRREVSA